LRKAVAFGSARRDPFFDHMHEAERLDELRALLLTPEWLNAQLRAVGPYAVMRAFGCIRGDRDLEMIYGAL
jgi:hypothetical protein